MKRTYNKREIITDTSFDFTKQRLQYQIQYQGNGKAPDKRYDRSTSGLCLFIYPSGIKVFCAIKKFSMYNKKKNRTEKNAVYKKIFRMEDHPQRDYAAAKLELPNVLSLMGLPKEKKDEKTFGALAKEFLKSGMDGFRLMDKSEKHEYKQTSIKKYTKIINSYILLKGSAKVRDRMSVLIEYDGRASDKPLKDYTVKEIDQWHIECVQTRMKDYKTAANDIVKMISIIYSWAIKKKKQKLSNPVEHITKFRENKIKIKMSDIDRDKILDYCEGKAFDFFPRFLTYVALLLLIGKRELELLECCWKQPITQKEQEACSGWLVHNWHKEKYMYLRDTKNRKPERVYLDDRAIKILQRLERSRFTDKNAWAIESKYLFPQRRNINLPATYSSFRKPLDRLNKHLDLETRFLFKYARKTFGSFIADKFGLERAASKLNHSSTKVTKDHYVVPEDRDNEIENIYESNVERFRKVE
jgi:integrase